MTIKACMVTSKGEPEMSKGFPSTIACAIAMLTDSGVKEYELGITVDGNTPEEFFLTNGVPFYFISNVSSSKNEVVTCCPVWKMRVTESDYENAAATLGVRVTRINESGNTSYVDLLGAPSYFIYRAYTPGQLIFFGVSRIKDSSNSDAGYFLIPAIEYSLTRKVYEGQVSSSSNDKDAIVNSFVFFTSVDGSSWARKNVAIPDYFKSPEFIENYDNSSGPFSTEHLRQSIQGNSNFLAFAFGEKLFYSKNGGNSWTTEDFPGYGLLHWYKKPNGERLLCMVIPQEDAGVIGVPLFDWAGNFILPSFSEDTPIPYTDVKWTPDMPRLDIFYHPNAIFMK